MYGDIKHVVLIFGLSCLAGRLEPATAFDLTPSQSRGKQIYTEGMGTGEEPVRVRIAGDVVMPASSYPCVQCHGVEGKGGFEGGVKIPEIQWQRLSSPHGVPTLLGGTRPSYTRETFARAVRDGIASSGIGLDPVMPRYDMSDADLRDLLAYLKVISEENAPGVDSESIRIGTILPMGASAAGGSLAAAEILRRYFQGVNERGGIHGRRIELVMIDAGMDDPGIRQAVDEARDDGGILAFVANSGAGASPGILRYLEQNHIPVIGPLTFARGTPGQGSVFYLLSSLEDQGRAAARYIREYKPLGGTGRIALITGPEPGAAERSMVRGFMNEIGKAALDPVVRESWPEEDSALADTVLSLRQSDIRMVVFFGGRREGRRLLMQAQKYNWRPDMMVSTVLLGGGMDAISDLFLVMPAIAPSASGKGDSEFRQLLHRDDGAEAPDFLTRPGHRAMEMVAFAAVKVLSRILAQAGRDLHLQDFLSRLRALKQYETGVMPPVGYGPNRRVGVRGALIARTSSSRRQYSTYWIDVTE